MKVKNINRHTVLHMWSKFVKVQLKLHPSYYKKHNPSSRARPYYLYNTTADGSWEEVMNYDKFRHIIEQFLSRAKEEVIQGNAISIPHCGRICAERIERDFRSKNIPVNWKKTMEGGKIMNDRGKMIYKQFVYFTDDEYCRIAWFKPGHIENIRMYEFIPTNSGESNREGGFKTEFSASLTLDPFLKYRYLYCPITDYVLVENDEL